VLPLPLPLSELKTASFPPAVVYDNSRVSYTSEFAASRGETMKGNPKVIAALQEALREELMAINQYFLHAEMCENWHYDKLGSYIKKQSIDEMKHAEALIERILFLDGTPDLTKPMQLTVGKNVRAQLESDLKLETSAVEMYNHAIRTARDEGDNASRELFDRLLKDEEEHVDWLEAQLHQIDEIGYERYLSQQIGEDEEE
jgi:bacterioferritin